MNIINCGYYSRAALIFLRSRDVRLLFEGGYYSMCGYYSNKYGIHFCILIVYQEHMKGRSVHLEFIAKLVVVASINQPSYTYR